MITRPMKAPAPAASLGHSEAPIQPQRWQTPRTKTPNAPLRRTSAFAFHPRVLPPVNKITGFPRLYG